MTQVVYTDLDGTMVGPGGSFFCDEERGLTVAPARALVDLLAAGIQLVLVSGRTKLQLVEAARIFGADGYIGELGAVLGWDRGHEYEVLPGAMPEEYAGRTPMSVLNDLGVLTDLFAAWPGRLEWHSPWHEGHDADAMLRGLVDVAQVEEWLRDRGLGWLRMHDNGVLPPRRHTTLHPDALPAHVYHLMPDGLSKGRAVGRDLARRGLRPTDAVAIGDSMSDLDMAAYVEVIYVVGNGARQPHMAEEIGRHENVQVCGGAVGLGWAEAIDEILAR